MQNKGKRRIDNDPCHFFCALCYKWRSGITDLICWFWCEIENCKTLILNEHILFSKRVCKKSINCRWCWKSIYCMHFKWEHWMQIHTQNKHKEHNSDSSFAGNDWRTWRKKRGTITHTLTTHHFCHLLVDIAVVQCEGEEFQRESKRERWRGREWRAHNTRSCNARLCVGESCEVHTNEDK